MTIAQKGTFQGNIDQTIDTAVDKAEKDAKEAIKKDKPSLYKHIATTYIQYGSIGVTLVFIAYKMFFADAIQQEKAKKQALMMQKAAKMQNMQKTKEDNKNAPASTEKIGKGSISTTKTDIKTVGLTNGNDVSISSLKEIPELKLPTVPDLPTIDKIEIKKNTEQTNDKDKNKEEIKTQQNIPPTPSYIPPSPIQQPYYNNNQQPAPSIAKPTGDMFVLKGNGPVGNQNKQKSFTNSKNDFILFDGSSLSIREVDNQGIKMERIANLENTITEGKVIEAVLETAINSELPGSVRAIVSKDSLAENGDKVIIPAGSRLYGTYTTNASYSETRVAIVWNKVIRPDGVVIQIDANASDQFGRAGIEGDVDTKYMQMFQNGLLLSFITLATSITASKVASLVGEPTTATVTTTGINTGAVSTVANPTSVAVNSVVQTATDIAKQMAEKLIEQVKPSISIPHGTILKVMVNKNITAGEYRKSVYVDR
ncbi:MAG: hypothetical protein RL208_290 [Pseudomonadota bacterium]|jgi:type IV secretion system protein VirB10